MFARWARWVPGLWLGVLLCIALIAAPSAFALLAAPDAGKVVSRIFMQEAWLSLALAALLLLARPGRRKRGLFAEHRSGLDNGVVLWAAVACTLLGYFAVSALMPAARAGQGLFSFGQLHLVSTVFYGAKTLLVALLTWRATART